MIIGEYETKVGEKKRIAIPKKLRSQLGNKLIITRGYEGCLILVNEEMWSGITAQVRDGSFTNRNIRDTVRFLIGSAIELDPDEQGRVVLPSPLYEYAKISDEIVFVGLINWVEVWDKALWLKRVKYLATHGDEIAQELEKSAQV